MHQHSRRWAVTLLLLAAALLASCGSRTGTIEGRAVWVTAAGETPIPGAIVELHKAEDGPSVFVTRQMTDEQGRYSFKDLDAGGYLIPLIMWESQEATNPCPNGGSLQQPMIGGWMDTQSTDGGVNMLMSAGRTLDLSGMQEQLATSRATGVAWLGFATVGSELSLQAGQTIENPIELNCT